MDFVGILNFSCVLRLCVVAQYKHGLHRPVNHSRN